MKIPTRDDIRKYLSESPEPLTKRELTDAFEIKGDHPRKEFNATLKAMEKAGEITKQAGAYSIPDALPNVDVVEVTEITVDGDIFAQPVKWDESVRGPAPRVEIMADDKKGRAALKEGDRVLARLSRIDNENYKGHTIRRLDIQKGRIVGTVERAGNKFVLRPTNKKAKIDFDLPQHDLNSAKEHDLVIGEIQPSRSPYNKQVRVLDVLGPKTDPKSISRISIHEAGLSEEFSQAALDETNNMIVPELGNREDLRSMPLVTIDGPDARDFDDAVWAEKTKDGFHMIVAIADVAYYVRPGSDLDKEAYERGNSTYFPDMVLPMLPEKLSNDLCSLRPHEDRACLAFHLWIDNDGNLKKQKIVRALMRSTARLTYEQVQEAYDGKVDKTTLPLMKKVINPLYEAYQSLEKAREKRGALEIEMPERRVVINDKNEMTGVKKRERLDSHKLIEEFMIAANVAAATVLTNKNAPCVFRVHDKPDNRKLDNVRGYLAGFNLHLPKGNVDEPAQLNKVLKKAADLPFAPLVNEVMLRTQMQACYHPENIGHFGLALERYAHFTSPIRRYADLLVHRSLIETFKLGEGGLDKGQQARLEEMSNHISGAERISAEAERNAVDRFAAAYLQDHIGEEFKGRIRGVTSAGLFISLEDTT